MRLTTSSLIAAAALLLTACADLNGPYAIGRAVPRPVLAAGGRQFTSISAGFFHTCAVDTQGAVWCWGDNHYRQSGLDAAGSPCDQTSSCVTSPHQVALAVPADSVSAGDEMSCALARDGDAYCWGGGYYPGDVGYLGGGAKVQSAAPVLVAGGLKFRSVRAGGLQACGLTTDDRVFCWGVGGHTGDGTTTDAPAPVEIAGGRRYRAIALGSASACAITTEALLYCWGTNGNGQLGNGTLPAQPWVPVSAPVQARIDSVEQVAVGGGHACAIRSGGAAWCWGDNHVFEAGVISDSANVLVPATIRGNGRYAQLAAGAAHSCAVGTDGVVSCWGGNWFGGLGDGGSTAAMTGAERPDPKPILSALHFTMVTAGQGHSCALATDGTAWCWGDRGRYQLADR